MRSLILEKNELKSTLESSGDTAENLLNQINALYNHAILIKDIGQYASSILDTELLLKYFMSTLEKNLEFSRGMVLLANSDRTHLVWAEGYGYSPEHGEFLKKLEFSLEKPNSRGMFVVCFRKQTPFLINNVSEIESGPLSEKSGLCTHAGKPILYLCSHHLRGPVRRHFSCGQSEDQPRVESNGHQPAHGDRSPDRDQHQQCPNVRAAPGA